LYSWAFFFVFVCNFFLKTNYFMTHRMIKVTIDG
jgi:hypothetical protein